MGPVDLASRQLGKLSGEMTGAEDLRAAVRLLNNCREQFLDGYSAEQCLALARAWRRAAWDVRPDEWTEEQVAIAIAGGTPEWADDGTPLGARTYGPDGLDPDGQR